MNGLTPHPVEVAVAVGGGMVAAGGAVGVAVVLGEVLVGAERRGVAPADGRRWPDYAGEAWPITFSGQRGSGAGRRG